MFFFKNSIVTVFVVQKLLWDAKLFVDCLISTDKTKKNRSLIFQKRKKISKKFQHF